MTGHHAGHHSRNAVPAADHRLDQFAAEVNEARANNPAIAALADEEQRLIDEALDIGAHLDRATLGAAWVLLGRLMFQRLQTTPPEQQPVLLCTLFQAARLAGARLYTGDRLPVELECPYTYASGAACKTVIKGPNSERAEVLLGAHAWQAHPGRERPTVEPEVPLEDQQVGRLPTREELGLSMPRHAPSEVCDCRPGETYHCAADADR